jgi:hypothetical protein
MRRRSRLTWRQFRLSQEFQPREIVKILTESGSRPNLAACAPASSHTRPVCIRSRAAIRIGGVDNNSFWLRVRVEENAVCSFSYSMNGRNYVSMGQEFHARQGKWIGAKVGIFAAGRGAAPEMGYADYDWFRIE